MTKIEKRILVAQLTEAAAKILLIAFRRAGLSEGMKTRHELDNGEVYELEFRKVNQNKI